jgi:hypothetical protein
MSLRASLYSQAFLSPGNAILHELIMKAVHCQRRAPSLPQLSISTTAIYIYYSYPYLPELSISTVECPRVSYFIPKPVSLWRISSTHPTSTTEGKRTKKPLFTYVHKQRVIVNFAAG